MALSAAALKKLHKDELVDQVLQYQSKFETFMDNIKSEFDSLSARVVKLESDLTLSRNTSTLLRKQVTDLERKCAANEQYSRRECLEISGIPESVSDHELEDTVLKIFSETGVTVEPENVEACHRLKSKGKPKKVIIKLSRRKDVHRVIKNKHNLKKVKPSSVGLPSSCRIYINESLCKYYKFLWYKCRLLLSRNCIDSFWVTNGSLRIKSVDGDVTTISHLENLEAMFLEEDLQDAKEE